MKREIKFRVWTEGTWMDGDNGSKMLYDYQDTIYVESFGFSDINIMQFTGLKDKNGVELYSGDIFKDERDQIYRCYNAVGGFAHSLPVFPSTLNEVSAWPLQPLAEEQTVSWFQSNCVIIGNIYQNPELLK